MEDEVVLNKLASKFAEKKVYTLLYTLAEKKYVAVIYTLVARLREVQVKTMGDTVTTSGTEALVETLSDSLIRIRSRRRTTK